VSRTMSAGHQFDLRNSVRFPLHLQVTLKTPNGEYHAKTTDISAGGILFHMESPLEVGLPVEFTIEMPVEVLGTSHPVQVICVGRVVRCSAEQSGQSVAVVIDEYHFKRL
jgi:PilZ domain